ncbi:MAG: Gfo/Idh/MocA family oxidoreductase [Phycisphaerales bacterium]|nr:Gfo/Idh/MocA family oxidoreductase [Phycisphaerales bacterium]
MKKNVGLTRRHTLKILGGAVATAGLGWHRPISARAADRLAGANRRIRLGMIGTGGMGTRHLEALAVNKRCQIVAVCDCFTPRYENAMTVAKNIGGDKPDGYQDFRHVLDRQDIDAIWVATPDHWHPLLTILGCQAGKDVYVEKPASPTVAEGRAMVEAARRYGRVVQLGTQQRSMPVFQKAIEVLHGGGIGQVTSSTAWIGLNHWRGIERPGPVPEGLDWDLWLGPATYVPYSPQRHYGHMGWYDYCRGGQLTNWGVHLIDIVHWGIQQDRCLSVQSIGRHSANSATADNDEAVESIYEYPGCTVTWEQKHWSVHAGRHYGIKFQGTNGMLVVDRDSYEVFPDSLGIAKYVGEPERSWANPEHHNNFFDCMESRKRPAADIEQGVRSTNAVLLAGIALKAGRKLIWDGQAERFIRDEQANRHLTRAYRSPWRL